MHDAALETAVGIHRLQRPVLPGCSGMIFSVTFVTSSGDISTSYSSLICSAMPRWLIPQEYRDRIFPSILSAFRLYLPMIFARSCRSGPEGLDLHLVKLGSWSFSCGRCGSWAYCRTSPPAGTAPASVPRPAPPRSPSG